MKEFGQLCVSLIIICIGIFINAWLFSTLWSWFISTTFNIQQLSYPEALGVVFVYSFLNIKKNTFDETADFKKRMLENIGLILSKIAYVWIIAYIVYYFWF